MKKKPLCHKPLAHGKSAENGQANWISAIATLINTDIVASGKFLAISTIITYIFVIIHASCVI